MLCRYSGWRVVLISCARRDAGIYCRSRETFYFEISLSTRQGLRPFGFAQGRLTATPRTVVRKQFKGGAHLLHVIRSGYFLFARESQEARTRKCNYSSAVDERQCQQSLKN